MIGKLIREHGEDKVRDAILATLKKDPAQKLQYLVAILRGASPGGLRHPNQMSEAELCRACEERGIATRGKDKWELIKMLTQ